MRKGHVEQARAFFQVIIIDYFLPQAAFEVKEQNVDSGHHSRFLSSCISSFNLKHFDRALQV